MFSLRRCLEDLLNYIRGVDDYVIQQGTSNGWQYRKWKSNKIEAWKQGTATQQFIGSWNGGYGVAVTLTLPFAVKNGKCFYHLKGGTGYGMPSAVPVWSDSLKSITLSSWGSQNGKVSYSAYVIGELGGVTQLLKNLFGNREVIPC